MFIKAIKKWRQDKNGSSMLPYSYYRLCESYRDARSGRPRQKVVMGLGELVGMNSRDELKELCRLLSSLIKDGEYLMSDNEAIREKSVELYARYKRERLDEAQSLNESEELKIACDCKEKEHLQDIVAVKWSTLKTMNARSVGAEHICKAIADELGMESILRAAGLDAEAARLGVLQTVARAVYPASELKTVRYLRENSALCELFGIDPCSITKDKLYKSAQTLYAVHTKVEDALHHKVCTLFDFDERILLFDLTNTYFEGRMTGSEICKFGNSKEKRYDARLVVLAAVVNREGMLVRTKIYEGNRQDVTTLEEVIGSLSDNPITVAGAKKLVVIDAGFSSASNLKWLRDNGYDYITVMRSRGVSYTESGQIQTVLDSRKQELKIQRVEIDGVSDTVVMVESTTKAETQKSMLGQQCQRYENGLVAIRCGLEGKGTKKRDKVNLRLGRLNEKYPSAAAMYDVTFSYNEKQDVAVAIEWKTNTEMTDKVQRIRGKYLLQTSLDENNPENVWEFYNVIRQVEETFKTLKSDLDIRPVFHKRDAGTKAHLNLAVMAYWLVSTIRYRLKKCDINSRWEEILRILSAQQRVTVDIEKANGHHIRTRSTTEPEDKAAKILHALNLPLKPTCDIKFVWHPDPPPKNSPP